MQTVRAAMLLSVPAAVGVVRRAAMGLGSWGGGPGEFTIHCGRWAG